MSRLIKTEDGKIVEFDQSVVMETIQKVGSITCEIPPDTTQFLANIVITELFQNDSNGGVPVDIREVQKKVAEVLMRKGFYDTAIHYVALSKDRLAVPEIKQEVSSNKIDILDLMSSYLKEETWEVHENANIDYSIQGLKAFITSKAEEIYWLEKVFPKAVSDLHKDGFVHIHNLGFLGSYCVGWDLEDLIRRGFGGVPSKPYSVPAKHFSSILGQMMNFLFTLQNEAAGAVAFSSLDTLLAPFVYFDKLTFKEVKQQIQEFVYNMNQTMRTGGQSPFSNITVDLTPHKLLRNRPVIIGGKEIKEYTYGMFQNEMDMINKALFEVYLEGDGHGRPFTFPIPTINISKDFNWDNPILDPLWEATAKYGIPYFANYINSDLKPEDARSMCCRLKLDVRQLQSKGGGLFGAAPLTGSVGVVTINLPRLAYLSKDEVSFFSSLNDVMDAVKEGLEKKREAVERFTEIGLYPYSKIYLEPIKESTGHYWNNHFQLLVLLV